MRKLLSIILALDALLAIGFGLVSYVAPESTYATIVDLRGVTEHSLTSSILGSLSVFYVVIGSMCLAAVFMPHPHDLRVAAVMFVQHAWVGLRGVDDMARPWIIGNPWPDLGIHSFFVIAYSIGAAWRLRAPRS